MNPLAKFISDNELWLMERILFYAKAQKFTDYTSTLVEAWRISIHGLSDAIIFYLDKYDNELPQFHPDENYTEDPSMMFGMHEACLHRERGISLQMFLGLYKYYRYSYVDLIRSMDVDSEVKLHYEKIVERVLDRVEIAFCSEWSGIIPDNAIKELQKYNRLITNEKNKYLTLFESLDIPVFLIDEQGNIDNMNPKAFSLLGLTDSPGTLYYSKGDTEADRPEFNNLFEILPWLAEDLKDFFSDNQSSIRIDKSVSQEHMMLYYNIALSKMLDVSGKFQGGIVIVENITEKINMERQLAQRQKLESIGQLAAGVAHEINTPIQFIWHNYSFLEQSFTDLFRQIDELTGPHQEQLKNSEKENIDYLKKEVFTAISESKEGVEHVSTIIKALKRITHLDYESILSIDLNESVSNVLTVTINEWKYAANVKTLFASDLSKIMARPGEISQVFLNIIINAAHSIAKKNKGKDKKGLITIGTRNIEDMVEIYFTDTGEGIPDENIHRIYDPFFTTKEVGEGVGQGLNIAYSIITRLNGTISCESSEGTGTSFHIRLPAANLI